MRHLVDPFDRELGNGRDWLPALSYGKGDVLGAARWSGGRGLTPSQGNRCEQENQNSASSRESHGPTNFQLHMA